MGFINSTKPYLDFNHNFGISQLPVKPKIKKLHLSHWTKYVQKTLHILLAIQVIRSSQYIRNGNRKQIELLLLMFYGIMEITVYTLILCQSLISHQRMNYLLLNYHKIVAYFLKNIDLTIMYGTFNRTHARKYDILLSALLLNVCTMAIRYRQLQRCSSFPSF